MQHKINWDKINKGLKIINDIEKLLKEIKTGYVYAIRSGQTDKVYIGSTFKKLNIRLAQHRADYKRYTTKGEYHYVCSYDIVKFEDHYIEELKKYQGINAKQLRENEGKIIKEMQTTAVNHGQAGRSTREWRNDNKEYLRIKKQIHYRDNREYLRIKKQIQYRENKDYYSKIAKNYRVNNKDKIAAKNREKVECECGVILTKQHLQRHKKNSCKLIN